MGFHYWEYTVHVQHVNVSSAEGNCAASEQWFKEEVNRETLTTAELLKKTAVDDVRITILWVQVAETKIEITMVQSEQSEEVNHTKYPSTLKVRLNNIPATRERLSHLKCHLSFSPTHPFMNDGQLSDIYRY